MCSKLRTSAFKCLQFPDLKGSFLNLELAVWQKMLSWVMITERHTYLFLFTSCGSLQLMSLICFSIKTYLIHLLLIRVIIFMTCPAWSVHFKYTHTDMQQRSSSQLNIRVLSLMLSNRVVDGTDDCETVCCLLRRYYIRALVPGSKHHTYQSNWTFGLTTATSAANIQYTHRTRSY